MKRTLIHHSDRFDLVSYGNGLSYALHDNVNKRSLFVQGEDASTLQAEIEAWERIDPDKPYNDLFAWIMSEYKSVTEAMP